MIRLLKKKLRKPKQTVVPEEPLQRLEVFSQQIRLLQRDPKALGTPYWCVMSEGIESHYVDHYTEVTGWRGLGFTGWIIHTRFYMSPLGGLS